MVLVLLGLCTGRQGDARFGGIWIVLHGESSMKLYRLRLPELYSQF